MSGTLRNFLLSVIGATAGGWGWAALGLPLGWLMGAALVTAALSLSGLSVVLPKVMQRGGLIVLASATGLVVTPSVLQSLLNWLPVMVVAVALSIGLAIPMTRLYVRLGGLDPATAFFSLLPGGVIEMANIGDRFEANRAVISAMHAIRVGLIVLILPTLAAVLSKGGGSVIVPQALPSLDWLYLLAVLAVGVAAGMVAARINMPAGWFLGPLAAVAAVSATGWVPSGTLPQELLIIAQICVGMGLGCKFRRETLAAVPRAIITGLPVMLGIGGIVALSALAASMLLETSAATLLLGTAGGGIAEMVITAKSMHEEVALVAGFHTLRAFFVNLCAGPLWARIGH